MELLAPAGNLSKLKTDINSIDNKLNNKKFIENAPKNIIDEQMSRKAKLENSVNRIVMALKNINKK